MVTFTNRTQPGKLKAAAAAAGKSIEDLIRDTLAETGSVARAAEALRVNRNSIIYWMNRNGYAVELETTVQARLVKVEHE